MADVTAVYQLLHGRLGVCHVGPVDLLPGGDDNPDQPPRTVKDRRAELAIPLGHVEGGDVV